VTAVSHTTLERLPWDDFVSRMDWRQGEHVTLIGPTGVGKTEAMIRLIAKRHWCVFLNTKRRDRTQDALRQMGFRQIRKGEDLNPEVARRYILSPAWNKRLSPVAQDELHAGTFSNALSRAFWQTGWTVAIDELEYINRDLRIEAPVNRLLRQGRSQGNSMILGTQRPRHVTLHAYEQATHLLLWRQSDMDNIRRTSDLTGVSRASVMEANGELTHHDILYVNTITGDMLVTNTRW
jgi:hypothetical protein